MDISASHACNMGHKTPCDSKQDKTHNTEN